MPTNSSFGAGASLMAASLETAGGGHAVETKEQSPPPSAAEPVEGRPPSPLFLILLLPMVDASVLVTGLRVMLRPGTGALRLFADACCAQ